LKPPFLSALSSGPIEKHHPAVFFYAYRYIEDAAFIDTLCNLEMLTGNFHFVPTFTRIAATPGWMEGATGPINTQMLSNYISNLQDPIYYVAGPPGMVAGTHQTLVELAVREEDIRTESFTGY
jgi:ferredoxin-NADP reductase